MWWSLYRGRRRHHWGDIQMDARVYLNGNGTDHELRFIVWDHDRDSGLPCQDCRGIGRLRHPQRPQPELPSIDQLFGPTVWKPVPDPGWDPVDSLDLRRCERCLGTVGRDHTYGASNSFCRTPGLKERLLKSRKAENASGYRQACVALGNRGLDRPSLADTLCVLGWCDDMLVRIRAGDVVWNDPADAAAKVEP